MGEVSWFKDEKVKGIIFFLVSKHHFQPHSKCSTLALMHFFTLQLKNFLSCSEFSFAISKSQFIPVHKDQLFSVLGLAAMQ